MGVITVRSPSHFHLLPGASLFMAPKVSQPLRRPITLSARKTGRASTTTAAI